MEAWIVNSKPLLRRPYTYYTNVWVNIATVDKCWDVLGVVAIATKVLCYSSPSVIRHTSRRPLASLKRSSSIIILHT